MIRMRSIVVGAKPRYGSTNGATISATAATVSTRRKRRCLSIGGPRLLAPGHAEQPARAQHQHERHRDEQHHVRIGGVEHRRDADDLPGDEAAQYRAGERSDAPEDDDDEG